MAKNILVPIDLNSPDQDLGTLEAALPLLDADGTLHAVTVLPDFGLPAVSLQFDRRYVQNLHQTTRDNMTEWIKENVPKGVKATGHILLGGVYDQILRTAEEVEADLIVIGAHRPGPSDYLLGSNAARVVRHAKQSVYVVRRPHKRDEY